MNKNNRTPGTALIACLCLASVAFLILPADAGPPPVDANNFAESCSRRGGPLALRAPGLQAEQDYQDGWAAMRGNDYASAEASFRASLSYDANGGAYFGLAEALVAQGRRAEALQTYWLIFHPDAHHSWGGSHIPQAQLEYALLLNQSGDYASAVAMYEKALPNVTDRGLTKINVHFDPNISQPTQLEAAIHLGIGAEIDGSGGNPYIHNPRAERAFGEYAAALKLQPDWPAANYYYGYGWQHLDLKTRARLAARPGQRAAVQSALAKASQTGAGEVRRLAAEELQKLK